MLEVLIEADADDALIPDADTPDTAVTLELPNLTT